jgi:ring-1,2-phenylacetyl-CoA epoxidase subunit PaaD
MASATATDVRAVVARVVDPEIPVLTIDDLGVLRDVEVEEGLVTVTITPTYSGCPAMGQIEDDIGRALVRSGWDDYRIRTVFSPAWTTDWITDEGHRKLADFGIAPPTGIQSVLCPQCQAEEPRMVARFGSTACKALMVCTGCGEPFDYFKAH